MRDAAGYANDLIGKPWRRNGLHCWRLVRDVQRDVFGRNLPVVLTRAPKNAEGGRTAKADLFANHPERARWREVPNACHGAVVLMHERGAPAALLIHAGVYLDLDGGGVLHTDCDHGVVFDSLSELAARGWQPLFLEPM